MPGLGSRVGSGFLRMPRRLGITERLRISECDWFLVSQSGVEMVGPSAPCLAMAPSVGSLVTLLLLRVPDEPQTMAVRNKRQAFQACPLRSVKPGASLRFDRLTVTSQARCMQHRNQPGFLVSAIQLFGKLQAWQRKLLKSTDSGMSPASKGG